MNWRIWLLVFMFADLGAWGWGQRPEGINPGRYTSPECVKAYRLALKDDCDEALKLLQSVDERTRAAAGPNYWIAVGYCQLERKEETAALASYKRALLAEPGNVSATIGAVEILSGHHLHATALAFLRQAIVAHPESSDLHLARAMESAAQGETEVYQEELRVLRQLWPEVVRKLEAAPISLDPDREEPREKSAKDGS